VGGGGASVRFSLIKKRPKLKGNIFLINSKKKVFRKEKNVYPFQREGG